MTRKIPRTGRVIASLNERTPFFEAMVADGQVPANKAETTLDQVLAELGLRHQLSAEDEETVRLLIGIAIGAWQSDLARPPVKDTKGTKVAGPTKGVTSTLESTAGHLEEAGRVLQAHQTGFQNAHDSQVVSLIQSALGDVFQRELGIRFRRSSGLASGPWCVRADYLGDFCQQLRAVVDACRAAIKTCEAIPRKSGLDQYGWYTDFTRALMFIAEKSGIKATVINRNGTAGGRFVELAEGFERLLPPRMRSPSPSARGQRLNRALSVLRSE